MKQVVFIGSYITFAVDEEKCVEYMQEKKAHAFF
jgi:hypothetical protein